MNWLKRNRWLLAWLILPWMLAAGYAQIPVSLPDTTVDPGVTQVTLPIQVGDLTGQNVIAYQTIVTFDNTILNCVGASSTGTLTEPWGPPVVNCGVPGQISLGGFGTSPLSGSGVLVNLIFDVVGQPGDTTLLSFQTFIFNAGTPAAATTNGRLIIRLPNQPPVLDPIPDQSMDEGATLNVSVSATDPDGNNITLSALNVPAFGSFTDNGNGTGSFTFNPGFDDAGVYPNIQVIATDDGSPNLSDTTGFTLTVNEVNRAPVLDSIPDQGMNEGETLNVPVSASDPDGNNITLTALNVPAFGSFTDNGNGTGSFTFAPGFGDAGVYPNIQVIATDDGSPALSDTTAFTLTVNNVNRPPALDPIPDQSMNEGETLNVPVSASDPDGNNITLTALNVPAFGSFTDNGNGTGSFTFNPGFDDAGVYPNIQVIATDDGSPALSDTTAFTLTVVDSNRAPAAVDDSVSVPEDSSVTVSPLGNDSDPDNDPLSIVGITQPSHGSAAINPGDSTITYTPNPNYFGSDAFTYQVSDGRGGAATATVVVEVTPVNDPPVISGLPDSVIFRADSSATLNMWDYVEDLETPDSLLTYDFMASNDSLLRSFDPTTGVLTLSADSSFSGTVLLAIMVSDPEGGSDEDSLWVVVEPVLGLGDDLAGQIPQRYELHQNYPNPFNPTTRIRFGIPEAGRVRIEIYNIAGQRVAVLFDGYRMPGYYEVEFDARQFASGIYFYRMVAGSFQAVKRMVLLK